MQTTTHASIGILTGSLIANVALAADPVLLLASAFAGAILPDTPMFTLFMIDLALGRPPMMQQSRFWIFLKSAAQNIFLWCGIVLAALSLAPSAYVIPLALFGANGFIHVVVDHYTHDDPRLNWNDGWYAWPFGSWRRTGWDYRYNPGILWPLKREESLVFYLSLNASAILIIFRFCLPH